MLKSLKITLYLFLIIQVKLVTGQTSYVIATDQTYINAANPIYKSVKPGDTLYFQAGSKPYLLIQGFKGQAGNPIVMINSGGPIIIDTDFYYGISIRNCQYIKFTGTGDPGQKYGFQIKRVAAGGGLSAGELSSDFEIDHVSIENTLIGGLYAKTDPDCDLKAVRSNFTQYNTIIHDNYIGHAGNEGMYIGSTKFTGQDVTCNGKDTLLLPSLLDGVQVYNNIVEYSGWDGIQVSSAYRNCNIYNNTVLYDSQAGVYSQMSGIIMGGGTRANCYNNFIAQGNGDGIECHGLGGCRIYNNIILNPGLTFAPTDLTQMKHGMYFSDVSVEKDSSFFIQNNNIINPKSDGIRFSSINSKNNVIASNVIINPGNYNYYQNGNTSFKGIDSYVMIMDKTSDVKLQNNYFSRTTDSVKFVSSIFTKPEDFKLLYGSPLIDKADVDRNITFDFSGSPRPFGLKSDIGAYEFSGPIPVTIKNILIQNVTGGGPFCDGGAGVEVKLSGSENGINYQLQLNGVNTGSPVSGTGSAITFGNQTGAGTYTVTAADTAGPTTSQMSGSAVITVNALPAPYSVTGGGAYCAGSAGVPVGLSNSQTGVNYQLYNGTVASGTTLPGTGSPLNFGSLTATGTYTVTATDSNTGCANNMTGNASVSVSALPSAPAAVGGTKSVCVGNTTNLTDATAGGVWSSLNPAIATVSSTGQVTGIAAGSATIRYTVTNAGGCSNFTSTVVTVNALPATPAVIGGSTSLCQGSTSTLTETTTGGVWSSSSNAIATVTSSGKVTGVAAGTATIKYTVTNGSGCSNSTTTVVTVTAPAAQPGKFTVSSTRISKGTANVPFTVPYVAGVIYNWSYTGTGATITGTSNSVLISFSLTATSGTLNVITTNGCGTSAARSLSISLVKGAVISSVTTDSTNTVNKVAATIPTAAEVSVDAAFAVPTDSTIVSSVLTPSEAFLVTPANNELNVYPNPTVNNATFEFQIGDDANVKVDIYSMTGQQMARIFDAQVERGITHTAYLRQSLPSGLYSCVMRWGSKMLTKKLIVMQ